MVGSVLLRSGVAVAPPPAPKEPAEAEADGVSERREDQRLGEERQGAALAPRLVRPAHRPDALDRPHIVADPHLASEALALEVVGGAGEGRVAGERPSGEPDRYSRHLG